MSPTTARLLLSSQERVALQWLREWSRKQLTQAKKRRKYLPRERVIATEEAMLLKSLLALEHTVGWLLAAGETHSQREDAGSGNRRVPRVCFAPLRQGVTVCQNPKSTTTTAP